MSRDVQKELSQVIDSNPVILFMKGNREMPQCGFSAKVCGILKASGKRFAFVNILEDPELRDGLKSYSNWPTFPQLYVNGELVGGSDIVEQMYQVGELETLLNSIDAGD